MILMCIHLISFQLRSYQFYVIGPLVRWCSSCTTPNYLKLEIQKPTNEHSVRFPLPPWRNAPKRFCNFNWRMTIKASITLKMLRRIERESAANHFVVVVQQGSLEGMHVKHFVRLKLLTLIFYLWANRRKYKHDRRTTTEPKYKKNRNKND